MTGTESSGPLHACCPQGDRLQRAYNTGDLLPFDHQHFVITVTRNRAEFSTQGC